ncbi:MAG: hypothetical protein FJZ47_03685 [Candidatus Tectomicrobia bacterium]|uniref:Uncharacterized protein n=1 Tax=Tectimicrobiota bacterium TaxID=2528274 RepID=A0A937W051_UNCTE|nr:hypothetical protein [Candidatus Tectomicrobia bacterium]
MLTHTTQEAVERIEQHLQQGQRHFTLTDAAAMTGLALDETREAMGTLLAKYLCRLQVSEHGDLIYHFGEVLRRRGEKTFAEWATATANWLWTIFTVIYKAWIAVTLVVYFLVFLVLLIVVIIIASARQSSDRRSSDDRRATMPPVDLSALLRLFAHIFQWRTQTASIDYREDQHGYRYPHYQPPPAALNTNKKSFMASVYDFVFGPPRVTRDPLANQQEVAAYLRQHKGLLVATELSALAGWTLPQAEAFFTDCLLRYRGDSKITDNAVLYGEFDEIVRSVGTVDPGAIVYYWDEYEADYELTGNSATHNLIIGLMNAFNLLMAWLVVRHGLVWLREFGRMDPALAALTAYAPALHIVLGWVPLVFSLLFFLIPLVRFIRLQTLRQRQHQENIRKRFFQLIFTTAGQPHTQRAIVETINADTQAETLAPAVVEEMMKTLCLDLAGDMQVTDAAEVQYAFPRITREYQEIQHLRAQRQVDGRLGDIIADSH